MPRQMPPDADISLTIITFDDGYAIILRQILLRHYAIITLSAPCLPVPALLAMARTR
jgi:hypothetical protein